MPEKNKLAIILTPEIVDAILKLNVNENSAEKSDLISQLLNLIQPLSPLEELSVDEVKTLVLKYDPKEIRGLKLKIKELLEKDTLRAMRELKKKLKEDSSLFDDITGLIARYNRVDKYLHKGVIKYSDAHLEFTKIDNSVIMMINEIGKEDLKKK